MSKILNTLLQEATKTAFDRWAAGVAAENRAKKKAIADALKAEKEEIKRQQRELAQRERAIARANKPSPLTLDQIWNKVETVIGNTFPDGDPIDHLGTWMERNKVTMDRIDAAAKKHAKAKGMYDYIATMWDEMQADRVHDAEMDIKMHRKPDENNPFYYFDGEKIVKNRNPWK